MHSKYIEFSLWLHSVLLDTTTRIQAGILTNEHRSSNFVALSVIFNLLCFHRVHLGQTSFKVVYHA